MQITLTLEVPEEYEDPDHETGLTEEGYMALCTSLDWDIVEGPEVVA